MHRNLCPSIELLEDRIAPASLITSFRPNSIKYTDVDGDLVTVSFSKSFITATNVNNIITLTPGGSGAVLQSIDLNTSTVGSLAALNKISGTSISITAKKVRGGTGNGLVDVGSINTGNINLGSVRVGGNLEAINVGSNIKNAVSSLTVDGFGTPQTTPAQPEPTATLSSTFNGNVPRLTVNGNTVGETINIGGSLTTATLKGNLDGSNGGGAFLVGGNIRTMSITGNVVGNSSQDSGELIDSGSVTTLTIGGNLDGSAGINGNSGDIVVLDSIRTVTIGGNVIGGAGQRTGMIMTEGALGTVRITGDLEGSMGTLSGLVAARQNITSMTVGGLGTDANPGALVSSGLEIGTLLDKGSVIGTSATPAIISAQGVPTSRTDVAINSLTVDGDMTYGVVLAGYAKSLVPSHDGAITAEDPNAQINTVVVKGNFTASDLVAGVQGTMNGNSYVFGTPSDEAIQNLGISPSTTILSKIASITIGGTVAGDSVSGANYGITAVVIGSLKVSGVAQSLATLPLALASNVDVDEVAV